MKAQTVIDVILGEAVHGTNAQRYEDMLGISSVIYNRSVATSTTPQAVVAGKDQFDAYGKNLPDGADGYRSLAEKAWQEVQTKGPVHNATYYATPSATKNLPDGLAKVTETKGHVYYEDPQNRPVVTTEGAKRPDPQAIAYAAGNIPIPTPRPEGLGSVEGTQLAYADPAGLGSILPSPEPQPTRAAGGGLGAVPLSTLAAEAPPKRPVEFANQGSVRNQPIVDSLVARLDDAVKAVYGPNYRVQVYSGGQDPVGPGARRMPGSSVRHDHGRAADVYVIGPGEKKVTGDKLAPLGQYWAAKGYGGVGLEMRGGGIHLDIFETPPGNGAMHWNYANPKDKGTYTPAQRAAMQAGLRGELPALYDPKLDPVEFMKNNPQPGGYGPAGFYAGDPNTPIAIPTSREQALAALTGNATASQAAGLGAQAPVTGAMPEAMPAPTADARVAAAHETTPAFQVNTPYTPFPAATAPAPVEVAGLGAVPIPTPRPDIEGERIAGLNAASRDLASRGIANPTLAAGELAPPITDSRIVLDYPVRDVSQGPLSPPDPSTVGPAPKGPDVYWGPPTVRTPDQAPIPTPRPSDGAMGAIPIPTPRPDTAAPAMASARTISDMPVAQDAGQFPGAGRDYFPPAPAPYFPPAPGANSGAFDSSPFWQTNTGGLGKFGGILKGAATGAAVGGLPGALVGGLLGSGALQKIFNNTPGGGNPSAPAAAAHGGYVGSGVNAMASVFSGKAAPGSLAASRSNPGTFAMSLPGGLVARSYESPTHGYITGIYGLGPNDDTNPGAKFGKVAALSPDAKSWSFVSPEEARGLQAKGWSVSIGPASKASVAAPADPSKAKAAVSPAPATTRAAVARSQAKEATPGKLGKAVADIGKAVAQAFGLGNMGLGIGGLGAAPSMASPSLAAPSMYGLVGQSGIGMGGIAGTGLGGYMGAGMGGGWSEANGPAGNRA